MADLVALSTVREGAYRLADQENKLARFPEVEVDRYINKGLAEWWDIIVSTLGPTWVGKQVASSISPGATQIPLIYDFFKFISIELATSDVSTDRCKLDPIAVHEVAEWANRGASRPRVYLLFGDTLEVYPKADRGYYYYFRYIPIAPKLVASEYDDPTFDTFNAWGDVYAETYAARMMALKDAELSLAQLLLADLGGLVKRIQALSASRDTIAPIRVRNVRRRYR